MKNLLKKLDLCHHTLFRFIEYYCHGIHAHFEKSRKMSLNVESYTFNHHKKNLQIIPARIENVSNTCEINVAVDFQKAPTWNFNVWAHTLKFDLWHFLRAETANQNFIAACQAITHMEKFGTRLKSTCRWILWKVHFWTSIYENIHWSSMKDISQNSYSHIINFLHTCKSTSHIAKNWTRVNFMCKWIWEKQYVKFPCIYICIAAPWRSFLMIHLHISKI